MCLVIAALMGLAACQPVDQGKPEYKQEGKTQIKATAIIPKSSLRDSAFLEEEKFNYHQGESYAVSNVFGLPDYSFSMFDFEALIDKEIESDTASRLVQIFSELSLRSQHTATQQLAQYCMNQTAYLVTGKDLKTARLNQDKDTVACLKEGLNHPVTLANLNELNNADIFQQAKQDRRFDLVLKGVLEDQKVTVREYFNILDELINYKNTVRRSAEREEVFSIMQAWQNKASQ